MELYNVLLGEGFRILTIDYRYWMTSEFHAQRFNFRGFGDSTDTSETEDTVAEDARSALAWLRSSDKLNQDDKIFVWGHSMGTGVAVRALSDEVASLGSENLGVSGLVLEAPYNNFTDEFIHHTKMMTDNNLALRSLYKITGSSLPDVLLKKFNMDFKSDERIKNIPCPIMIIHARGDKKIPIRLGQKLYQAAVSGGNKNVQFFEFDDSFEHR